MDVQQVMGSIIGAGRPNTSSPTPPLPRPVLLGLFLLSAMASGVMTSVVGPTVPALAARLHMHESDMGIIFGANFLAATLTTPLAGRAIDMFGPRRLVPLGLLAEALGVLGQGTTASLPLVTVAAALAGCGMGSVTVCSTLTVGSLFPLQREAALNAQNAFFGAGAFLGPLLVRFSLVQFSGYQAAYMAAAALLALPVLPFLVGLPAGRLTGRGIGNNSSDRFLIGERRMWAHAALSFFYLGTEIGFGGWIVVVLQHIAHLSAIAAAPIASVYWLFLALGGVPTAFLLHQGVLPARIIATAAAGAVAVTAALALFGAVIPVAVITAALLGLTLSPILPLNIAAAGRLASAQSPGTMGSSTALVLMAGQLGGTILPSLQGVLLTVGPKAAIGETCVCSLFMLGIQHTIIQHQRLRH